MNLTGEERTKELLKRLAQVGGFEKVSAFAEDAKLVVEGCVESYALKHQVEETARETGFAEIDNRLRIYPCEQESPSHSPVDRSSSTARG
jgi:hypothetical protein